jgi:hypothetical protein
MDKLAKRPTGKPSRDSWRGELAFQMWKTATALGVALTDERMEVYAEELQRHDVRRDELGPMFERAREQLDFFPSVHQLLLGWRGGAERHLEEQQRLAAENKDLQRRIAAGERLFGEKKVLPKRGRQ